MDNLSTLMNGDEPALHATTLLLKESLATVLGQLQVAAEDPFTARGSEAVHQLRIATRRAAAALNVFAGFLPRKATRRLQRDLGQLRKSVGALRDADVFHERMEAHREGDVGAFVRHRVAAMREEGRAALQQLLHEWNGGARLERRATKLICAIEPRRGDAHRATSFREFAARRLKREVRSFIDIEMPDPRSLKRLHAFRLRVKELRYTLELLRPALSETAYQKAYAAVKKLAQRLGDINDYVTAIELLQTWRKQTQSKAETRWVKELQAADEASLDKSLEDFTAWWSPRRQQRLRKRLKRATQAERLEFAIVAG